MIRPKALDHLALKVTDMDKTLHFYHDVLGLALLRTSGPNAEGGRSAVLQAGDQKIDVFFRPDFVSADKDKSVGMDHLCLIMEGDTVEPLMTHLQQASVEIFWGPVERHGSTSVYVYDPDGMHVELRVHTSVPVPV
jgi:catechol 2,3-dioxygenase-like lactoylglutathione lyase family enzyme